MNKRELLDRAAATAEERMTLARVLDKYEQCQRGCFVTHTDFLTPQEQSAAEDLLRRYSLPLEYCIPTREVVCLKHENYGDPTKEESR